PFLPIPSDRTRTLWNFQRRVLAMALHLADILGMFRHVPMKPSRLFHFGLGSLAVAACSFNLSVHGSQTPAANPSASAPAAAPIHAAVSIAPLRGLIEPLLPPGSKVELLVPAGVSEHGYEIPPARLASMAKADLLVYVGMGMEPQIDKALA